MNTTAITNDIAASQSAQLPASSLASEVLFFVKSGVAMTAMVLLLASAWV
ncbi:hypothetical protein [Vibrio methylphosphonaticus]|nr:hypothetical protein [Vibrio methylphosphonaticus]MCL9776544.1 hypothetical protein [Vibrio methylphosphonaticus]